ncbi:Mov34/MPN/PAD-1 family protein [Methylotuvimicrobium buryatense]|uniref:Mov34/MPN/PAD-1 family protein n=1 Tax=Methylotuvimicrobium buryatense TaxID=95641 RepID=UPI00036DDC0E|nr:Mov34/MPN/PAD-1 family protein [Methylotuvimicrobium buryatense]
MSHLWISETAFRDMVEEANRACPMETGGVLVGYFAEFGEPVVFAAIGPGPNAIHLKNRFMPDHTWQCEQLEGIFQKSSGTWVYLGDWHTHPDCSARMSRLDQRTLRSIAKFKQAENPKPLMLIGGYSSSDWDCAGYQYLGNRLFRFLVSYKQCSLRLFPILNI